MSAVTWIILAVVNFLLILLILKFAFSSNFRKEIKGKQTEGSAKIFKILSIQGTTFLVLCGLFVALDIFLLSKGIDEDRKKLKSIAQNHLIFKLNGELDDELHKSLDKTFSGNDSVLQNVMRDFSIDTMTSRLYIRTNQNLLLGYVNLNDRKFLSYLQHQRMANLKAINPANGAIKQIWGDLKDLRSNYEGIDHSDYLYRNLNPRDQLILLEVREKARSLLTRLETINTDDLSVEFKLLKYHFRSYLKAVLAQTDPDQRKRSELSRDGVNDAVIALQYIGQIRDDARAPKASEHAIALFRWVQDEYYEDILHSIIAWLYAIEALVDGKVSSDDSTQVLQEYNKTSSNYRQRYPLKNNPSLRHVIDERNDEKQSKK